MKEKKICKVEGCNNIHQAKGYCENHYRRFKKYGDPLFYKREPHRMSSCAEYIIWHSMKDRCNNKNNNRYYRYGKRGIYVCKEWQHSFSTFYKDMGERPSSLYQLDRIDNDLGYCKNNCKWVLRLENIRHTSSTKLSMEKAKDIRYKYFTLQYTKANLAREYNTTPSNIISVIKNNTWKEVNNV